MPLRSAASAARAWARALPGRHGGAAVLVALAVIVLLGLVLRLGAATDPNHDQRGDWLAYERIAQALHEEGQYGDDAMSNPSEWSPGAPFLFAAVYAVTGAPYVERGLIVVAFLGAAMVLGVYLLGRRLGGHGANEAGGRVGPAAPRQGAGDEQQEDQGDAAQAHAAAISSASERTRRRDAASPRRSRTSSASAT